MFTTTTTLIKKWIIALCAVAVVFSLAGCAAQSAENSSPSSIDEQTSLMEATDGEITLPPIQEHNSTDKQPINEPPAESDPNKINEPITPMEREAMENETSFPPKEWLFNIRQPKKQVSVTDDEISSIEKIEVNHFLAGKAYDYTFSSSEEIAAILSWYKSLKLKTATFLAGEQAPNMKEGGSETYAIHYKDGTQKEFWYYSGDEYIYMVKDDVWYEITN